MTERAKSREVYSTPLLSHYPIKRSEPAALKISERIVEITSRGLWPTAGTLCRLCVIFVIESSKLIGLWLNLGSGTAAGRAGVA